MYDVEAWGSGSVVTGADGVADKEAVGAALAASAVEGPVDMQARA